MSNLKKARNLLNNPRATLGDLESILADLNIVLNTNIDSLTNDVKDAYFDAIARLTIRIQREKGDEKSAKEEKNKDKQKQKQHYFNDIKNRKPSNVSYEKPRQEIVIPGNMENKYTLPDFFPDNTTRGDYIWLNYVDMKSALNSRKRVVRPDKTELIFTRDFPDLWIGDLFVQSRKQINHYKSLLEVEPTLNPERIRKLYEFYMENYEYRPMHKGELFWTRTPPVRANRPQNNYLADGKKIMPSKIADYLVKVKGFVVFVNGIDADILCRSGNVFDFVYTGTNNSNASGRGFFIKDSIRKAVTEQLYRHLPFEK